MTSTRAALFWSFAGRYLNIIVALATSMILARILTPSEVGKFSLCAAALAIAGTVREFGVSEYIIQEKQLSIEKLRSAFAVALITSWSAGAAVFALRGPLATFYSEPELEYLLGIMSMNFLLLPVLSPVVAQLTRGMEFKTLFHTQLAATLAQNGFGIGFALLGMGAASLAWASVAGIAAQTLVCLALRPRNSLVLPSFRNSSAVFRYGAYAVTGRILDTSTANAHEFVIGKLFGFTAVGIFSRARGLIDIVAVNIAAAVNSVVVPAMAKAHRSEQNRTDACARGTAIFTAVAWPFYGFVAVASPEIVLLLFGSQWSAAASIATNLAMSLLPTALFSLCPSTLSAMGHIERRLRISLIFNPLHIVALCAMAFLGGFEFIAFAWVSTSLVMLYLNTRNLQAVLNARVIDLYGPSFKSALLGLATALAAYLALELTGSQAWSVLSTVLIAAVSGAGAWLLAARSLRHPVFDEVTRVVAAVMNRRADEGAK